MILLAIKLINGELVLIVTEFITIGLLVRLNWGNYTRYVTKEEFEKFRIENSENKETDKIV